MVAEAPGDAGIRLHGAGAEVVPLERVRAAHRAAPARLARQAPAGRRRLAESIGELDEVGRREVDAAPVGLEVRRLPRPVLLRTRDERGGEAVRLRCLQIT